jgi:hypothetical protein
MFTTKAIPVVTISGYNEQNLLVVPWVFAITEFDCTISKGSFILKARSKFFLLNKEPADVLLAISCPSKFLPNFDQNRENKNTLL